MDTGGFRNSQEFKKVGISKLARGKYTSTKKPKSGRPPKSLDNQGYISSSVQNAEVFQYLSQLEQELCQRLKDEKPISFTTKHKLESYVRESNEQALNFISIGDFSTANKILHSCQNILQSPIGENYPALKFKTFNNQAHLHNIQGNITLSIKHLIKALDYGLQVKDLESIHVQYEGADKIPIVETYINVCNAYQFQGLNNDALQYAEGAIMMSQRIIETMIMRMDDVSISQEIKDQLSQHYHHLVNLHILSYSIKGQILEKLKRYDDAIGCYFTGKQVVEANYGHSHKMYLDLSNAINGAKLRTKYIQNSHISSSQSAQQLVTEGLYTIPQNYKDKNNQIFFNEQERIKPINQQHRKIRIQSAVKNRMPIEMRQIPPVRIQNMNNFSAQRLSNHHSNMKEQIQIYQGVTPQKQERSRPRSSKSQYSSKKIHSHRDNEDCASCHGQIEEMRQLHIEQQKVLNMILQQQQIQQQQMNQQNQQQNFNDTQSSSKSQQQQFQQQMQTHQMQPGYYYPPMPHPYQGFPQYSMPPYPQMPGPYLPQMTPPQNFPVQQPFINNYFLSQQPSNQHQQMPQPQFRRNDVPPTIPTIQTEANSSWDQFRKTLKTVDDGHTKPVSDQNTSQNSSLLLPDFKGSGNMPINQKNGKKQIQKQSATPSNKEKEEQAAIYIQKQFRRFKCQKEYQILLKQKVNKQKFIQQSYEFIDERTKQMIRGLLIVHIELNYAKGEISLIPKQVVFNIQNQKTKQSIFSIAHQLDVFSLHFNQKQDKDEVCIRVKSLLNLIIQSGNPKIDFSAQSFKKAFIRSKEFSGSNNAQKFDIQIIEDKVSQKHKKDKSKDQKKNVDPKDIEKAAIMIQKQFRRFKCQKEYKLLLSQKEIKQRFILQTYEYLEAGSKIKLRGLLSVHIVLNSIKGKNSKHPNSVHLQVYNPLKKSSIFFIKHKLKIFSLNKHLNHSKEEVCCRVKSLLTLINLTGKADWDFSVQSFKKAFAISKDFIGPNTVSMVDDEFIQDNYNNESDDHDDNKSRTNPVVKKSSRKSSDKSSSSSESSKSSHKKSSSSDSKKSSKKSSSSSDSKNSSKKSNSSNDSKKSKGKDSYKYKSLKDATPVKIQSEKQTGLLERMTQQFNQDKKKESRQIYIQKVIKCQALVRGFLTRQHYQTSLQLKFKVLFRNIIKLKDGKTYHVFLMGRDSRKVYDEDEIIYQVTARDVQNINHTYDLQISLKLSRSLFKIQGASPQEIDTNFIIYHRNKKAFHRMIQCLDILEGDGITLDFKKFKQLSDDNGKATKFIENEDLVRKDGDSEFKKSSSVVVEQVSKPDVIIEEVKTDKISKIVDIKIKKVSPPIKRKNIAKEREQAAVKIQSLVKGHLARTQIGHALGDNFRVRAYDPRMNLFPFQKSYINLCGLYFLIIYYTDPDRDHIRVTMREMTFKVTIINLMNMSIDDLNDPEQEVQIEDLCMFIEETLKEHGPQILLDEETRELRDEWPSYLNQFMETQFTQHGQTQEEPNDQGSIQYVNEDDQQQESYQDEEIDEKYE